MAGPVWANSEVVREAKVSESSSPAVLSVSEYKPLLSFAWDDVQLSLPLSLVNRVETTTRYPLDKDRTEIGSGVNVAPQARVGLSLNTGRALKIVNLVIDYEHDVYSGDLGFTPGISGAGLPATATTGQQIRKAWARFAFDRYLHVGGGITTSHWGMGLVANNGAQHWTPGSARFTDPRGGDRVLRGSIATGPYGDWGFLAAFNYDQVIDDDALLTAAELNPENPELATGDKAQQFSGALVLGYKKPWGAGVYVARRSQTDWRGGETNVWVVDATARAETHIHELGTLKAETELAFITGTTSIAGSPAFPEHDVAQFAAAGRIALDRGNYGGVLDAVYASGDQNIDDGNQNGFRIDSNFDMGMLLYRQVLSAQTGRGVATASDPELVGYPSAGIERFATRGSITNTVAFFPRAYWQPLAGLEVYGGPLVAFNATSNIDPLNTRLAGGSARNALNAKPGTYLGTELDIGIRYQTLMFGTELTAGAEFGILQPGAALNNDNGNPMRRVYGARGMIQYRL